MYSLANMGCDTLEKLSIVRTLPNAPDFFLCRFAVGSVGCLSLRRHGAVCPGAQESLNLLSPLSTVQLARGGKAQHYARPHGRGSQRTVHAATHFGLQPLKVQRAE